MRKIKRILTISLAFILLSLVLLTVGSAFWGKKDTGTKLKVIWWGSQARHEMTLKVIEMFKAQNPNVQIEPIYTAWGGYFEKLVTLAAGGELPDVISITLETMDQYRQRDFLADLSKIKSLEPVVAAMDPGSLESGKIGGKLYGICLGANAMALVYNKEIFDAAGVAVPNEKSTWADIETMSNTIFQKTGKWGLGNISQSEFPFFARSKGEAEFNKTADAPGFSLATATEFMKLIQRMHKTQAMEPRKIAIETASNEENSPFAKGNTAMRFMWSNKVVSVSKAMNKVLDMTVFPGPGTDQAMYVRPSMFFCVGKLSKFKEDAGKFINYFVTDIEANKVLQAERGVPVVAKVREAMAANLDDQNKKIFAFIDLVAKVSKRPPDVAKPAKANELRRIMGDIMEQVYYEKLTPEAGAKKLIQDWKVTFSR